VKSKLRDCRRQSNGRSRQRTAASRRRLDRMNSRDNSRVEAELPPGTERSPPTTRVVPPSHEMDKESAEVMMTDIVLGIDDIDDNSDDDGEHDDVAETAQHWLLRDRRHFQSQDRHHHL